MNNITFKGLLTLEGPDKEHNIVVNTDNISTLSKNIYFDKKDDSILGVGSKQNTVITMNNGVNIRTYLPTNTVIDAYKKATSTGDYKLETPFNPLMSKLL
jgi:hypothetical protein